MKVITAEGMRLAERLATEQYGISGLAMMEAAGHNCAGVILAEFSGEKRGRIVIVAGKGNNGGDGFVIARHLREYGWQVKVFVLAEKDDIAADASVNLERLDPQSVVFCPDGGELARHAGELDNADLLIDALFGTGLRSEIRGIHAEAVELLNASGRPVVSVDIPSGVDATTGRVLGVAVRADLTVTFAFAKMGHVLYPGAEYCGRLEIAGIGLPAAITEKVEGGEFLDAGAVKTLLRRRARCSHKGDFGHCLILAGSTGKTGAAALAANSAVRTGSGLVTLAVPASLNSILEMKTTEAMTLPLQDSGKGFLNGDNSAEIMNVLAGKDAVAVGPGVSWNSGTSGLIRELVGQISLPMVVDADGLNALSEDVQVLLRSKSDSVILTPHPGEMARLTGKSVDGIEADRIGAAVDFAVQFGVHVVLKGARTVVAAPDGRVAINGSGNPGMASGGMGDVLTGIVVSLLGQGYPAFDACRIGVFLHGYAADLVAYDKGEIGISATDVQEQLPRALKKLMLL